MEETLDGRHWVIRGYDRLPRRVAVRALSCMAGQRWRNGWCRWWFSRERRQFVPTAKTGGKRAQIVEKDDFDL